MKKYLILISILFPLLIFSQQRIRLNSNDIERYHLKGKVKSLKYFVYDVKYLNDSVYEIKIEDFIVPKNYKIEFNKNGYITKKTEYRSKNDSLIKKGVWLYEYDNNKIKNEIYYWNNNSKDTSKWTYNYPNKNTTLITQQSTMSPKLMYYSYQQNKNKEYYKSANADSSFIRRTLNVYDKKNRIIRIEKYDNLDYIQDIVLKSYSDSLNPYPKITISSYTKYDAPFSIIKYIFNSNNDIIEYDSLINSDNKKNIIEYKYDTQGNWLEKTEKGGTGKIYKVYRREFTYY